MIWESSYWKDDILKRAEELRRKTKQKRWSEASMAKFEQTVMVGFYSIRKLIEARKLSDSTCSTELKVTVFVARGKPVTLRNWHKLDELYDLEAGTASTREIRFLCNQVIHSYVFIPILGEKGGIERVVLASDFERNRQAFEVMVSDLVELFKRVGTDYPTNHRMEFNPTRKDYDVTAGNVIPE